jgi:hypothetical protein
MGRFVAVEADEPAPEPEPEQDRLYAGKYKTVDELEKAVFEQQQFESRRNDELHQLRQQVEQLGQQMQTPRTTFNLNDLYEQDPGMAADAALAAGDTASYQQVLRAWHEEDPGQARQYATLQQARYEAYQARQEIEQIRAQQSQGSYEHALASAYQQVSSEMPDFEALAPAMRAEVQEAITLGGHDPYTPMLESGDPQRAAYALRTLANNARSRMSDVQREQAAELARAHAAESVRAKAEAVVSSATSTAPDPPQPKSYDQQFLEEIQEADRARRDGFQVEHY